ncbi:hypothetical protein VNO78_10763 [Psophocarpus tetragonolobus]|uniref:Uncharacterized protein n=1 Tax=Psophocarpus tetragonolobus TaxID=3891 RepID=A0AAN9XMI8_PSOTE
MLHVLLVKLIGTLEVPSSSLVTIVVPALAMPSLMVAVSTASASCSGSGSSTPRRGQMVYHYHKERVARLEHYSVTPETS